MTDRTEPLSWVHEIAQIAGSGAARTRIGTPAERVAVAKALDLQACDRLDVRYTLKPFGKDRYRLTGTLEADVVQACVVTLEPLAEKISETFDIEFVPAAVLGSTATTGESEREILSGPDVEPLDGNVIDVGRVVFELVSASLDPYPRKEGAEFDWSDPRAEASKAAGGAFAALAKLKLPE